VALRHWWRRASTAHVDDVVAADGVEAIVELTVGSTCEDGPEALAGTRAERAIAGGLCAFTCGRSAHARPRKNAAIVVTFRSSASRSTQSAGVVSSSRRTPREE
jgi:hypothetical protein